MRKDIRGDHRHLTHSDRIYIEEALGRGDNFRTIAKALSKRPDDDFLWRNVRLMTCHINSVARDSLNGKCPFDLAKLLLSEKVLTRLGLRQVSPDEVILKPALLKFVKTPSEALFSQKCGTYLFIQAQYYNPDAAVTAYKQKQKRLSDDEISTRWLTYTPLLF